MRIIKEGRLPEKQTYLATCQNCKTEFEFERGEARIQSGARNDSALVIPCPLCSKEVWVDPYTGGRCNGPTDSEITRTRMPNSR